MQKHEENLFIKKFEVLNSQSQEYTDVIRWSSSEASDYENSSSNVSNLHRKRKRKRKEHTNISNLNITIINVPETRKVKTNQNDNSPVLKTKYPKKCGESPILGSQHFPPLKHANKQSASPIIKSRTQVKDLSIKDKSPVLVLKHQSPIGSCKVIKKLFLENNNQKSDVKNGSPKLKILKHSWDSITKDSESEIFKPLVNNGRTISIKSKVNLENTYVKEKENNLIESRHSERESSGDILKPSIDKSGEVFKPKTKSDLVKKVQSYFDSQFSSESASQQSISESETPTPHNTSKSSEDFEILNFISQPKDFTPLSLHGLSTLVTNQSCAINLNSDKLKKNKYKKDGLAYRLAGLLKKQNTNISLWQHEKFLAENSNFVIPKSEHTLFRIQKVHFKYGCYLIEAKDLNDIEYILLINGFYVTSNFIIADNLMIKIYEPFRILNFTDCYKIIVNVCKFECVPIPM